MHCKPSFKCVCTLNIRCNPCISTQLDSDDVETSQSWPKEMDDNEWPRAKNLILLHIILIVMWYFSLYIFINLQKSLTFWVWVFLMRYWLEFHEEKHFLKKDFDANPHYKKWWTFKRFWILSITTEHSYVVCKKMYISFVLFLFHKKEKPSMFSSKAYCNHGSCWLSSMIWIIFLLWCYAGLLQDTLAMNCQTESNGSLFRTQTLNLNRKYQCSTRQQCITFTFNE